MNERDPLDQTQIYCQYCHANHSADIVEHDGAAFWQVHCPRGEHEFRLSSDASLFRKFRAQAKPLQPCYERAYTNCVVHINDNCSLQCPICFENAKRTGWQISLEELREQATYLKKVVRPINIMLSGGEPTEHPRILDIVRVLGKECGFHCSILTNGVRLGREPHFAADLHAAGLSRVTLSFDTFDPKVSEIMRGRGDLVDIKLQAVVNCDAAQLNCGFETTTCQLNLPEIPKIAGYLIARAGKMSLYDLQCYQASGRIIPGLESVDREEIVKTLVASGVVPGMTEDDFRVSPAISAMGYGLHPDCGCYVLLSVKQGHPVPISHTPAYDAYTDDLARLKPGPRWKKKLALFALLARHLGPNHLFQLRRALRYTNDPKREYLQMISVSSLMLPNHLDCQRVKRCFSGVVTRQKTVCPPCVYYGLHFEADRQVRTPSEKKNSPTV